jgi:hypothetical protein
MPVEEFRFYISFWQHRKTKKLTAALGDHGVLCLQRLWSSTAQNRPKGILHGYSELDVALESGWTGDPSEFVRVLLECEWLDRDANGIFSLHNWKERQPWAYWSKERSRQARENAEKRWTKKLKIKVNNSEKEMPIACDPHKDGNAPTPTPTPSPSPSPFPTPEKKGIVEDLTNGVKESPVGNPVPDALLNPLKDEGKDTTNLVVKEKSKDSRQALSGQRTATEEEKKELARLCAVVSRRFPNFNPFAWLQRRIGSNPATHLKVMEALSTREGIISPWALADHIALEEDPNFNEKDSIEQSEKFKAELSTVGSTLRSILKNPGR